VFQCILLRPVSFVLHILLLLLRTCVKRNSSIVCAKLCRFHLKTEITLQYPRLGVSNKNRTVNSVQEFNNFKMITVNSVRSLILKSYKFLHWFHAILQLLCEIQLPWTYSDLNVLDIKALFSVNFKVTTTALQFCKIICATSTWSQNPTSAIW
jgi:hypothetical protein